MTTLYAEHDANRILTALGVSWRDGGKHIRCPFPDHEDRHPSWRWDRNQNRWNCTCGSGDIIDVICRIHGVGFVEAKNIAESIVSPPLVNGKAFEIKSRPLCRESLRHKDLGLPSDYWLYRDAAGSIVEVRARYEKPDGKEVLPWTWSGRHWINKAAKGQLPLYNLPALLARPSAPVLFVEGEKTAEAAALFFPDYVTTTTAGGCKNFARSNYDTLKSRDVVVWPDNDQAGRVYAANVSKRLYEALCGSQRIVKVPDSFPDKWDLADAGPNPEISYDTIRDLMLNATICGGAKANGHAEPDRKIKFDAIELSKVSQMLNAAWSIKGLVPAKGLMVIYGEPGSGKSFVALDMSLHIAAGLEYAGKKVFQAGVVYVAAEGQAGFQNRVWAARESLKLPPDTPFWLITTPPDLGKAEGDAKILLSDIRAQVPNVGVLVIDTLARTMNGASENSDEGMGAFIANASILERELDCLTIPVHHTGKDTERGMRGHSSLLGAADCVVRIENKDGVRNITIEKQKDGQSDIFWTFALDQVEIGEDADGDPVTTCLVNIKSRPRLAGEPSVSRRRKSNAEIVFGNAFDEVAMTKPTQRHVYGDGPIVQAINVEDLRAAFFARWATGETEPAKRHDACRKAFSRMLQTTILTYGREADGKVEWIWKLQDAQ